MAMKSSDYLLLGGAAAGLYLLWQMQKAVTGASQAAGGAASTVSGIAGAVGGAAKTAADLPGAALQSIENAAADVVSGLGADNKTLWQAPAQRGNAGTPTFNQPINPNPIPDVVTKAIPTPTSGLPLGAAGYNQSQSGSYAYNFKTVQTSGTQYLPAVTPWSLDNVIQNVGFIGHLLTDGVIPVNSITHTDTPLAAPTSINTGFPQIGLGGSFKPPTFTTVTKTATLTGTNAAPQPAPHVASSPAVVTPSPTVVYNEQGHITFYSPSGYHLKV